MELLQLPIYAPSVSSVAGPSGRTYYPVERKVWVLDEDVVDLLRRDFNFVDPEERNYE